MTYAQTRSYAVAESLSELGGPTSGVVVLPTRLAWSGLREFDLDEPLQRRSLYKIVLNEGTTEDLRAYLDARTLRQLWPDLVLPPRLRNAWEARFPELTPAA